MKLITRAGCFGQTASHDRRAYREYQIQIGHYYLHHFVRPYTTGKRILDIGCAEGGLLTAFERENYICTGLEPSPQRIQYAKDFSSANIRFICGEIETFWINEKFDVILMLDVLEHIEKKIPALINIKQLLNSDGLLIVSFPPVRSPFGGHQQVMKSFLKFIPYIHLLPERLYRLLLERIERDNIWLHLNTKKTGLTMGEFEQMTAQVNLTIIKKIKYFVRPRQALRFGFKVRTNRLPLFQEYLTTGVVFILKSG